MNKLICGFLVSFVAGNLIASEPSYVGADKCAKMCHRSEKKGNQYGSWKKDAHSNAYKTLGTEQAKQVALKAGIKGDPQKADACLKCHVTTFGVGKELIDSTFSHEDGISCESCHGPGSQYQKLSIMKDPVKARAAGLVEPDEKVCIRCHNPESPTYKPFDYKERVQKIAHPNPAKAVSK